MGRRPGSDSLTRRETLRLWAAIAVGGIGPTACNRPTTPAPSGEASGPAPSPSGASAALPNEDALDHALRLLADREPESKDGLSTHAPMVADALCSMGHGERAVAWVEVHGGPVVQLPRPASRIPRDGWRAALGPRPDAPSWEATLVRWGDWKELFVEELAEAPWRSVLDEWTGRLAPGLSGAATHGIIRTSHAARALARRETPERRAELARGLAYWASAYQELPVRHGVAAAGSYAEALARVPLHTAVRGRAPDGNIVAALHATGELAGFADAVDLAPQRDDVSAALSEVTATFADVLLRSAKHAAIAFVHSITAPCALRRIAPHVKPETARAALPFAWQAAAGIYSAYAHSDDTAPGREPRSTPPELVARAVEDGDAHAIKVVDALLGEHAVRADARYVVAAERALELL